MGDAEPDWYPDPRKTAGVFRWWTGTEWTDLLSADPDAPSPAPEEIERSVVPSAESKVGHSVRNTVLGALVLLLVLSGLTAAGLRSDEAPKSYPSTVPTSFGTPGTPTPPVPDLLLDEGQNTVTLAGQMSATMPAGSWDPAIEYTFTFGRSAATRRAVHDKYRGEELWYAAVTLGTLDRQFSQLADAEAIAHAVLDSVLTDTEFFYSAPFEPESIDFRAVEMPGEPGLHRFDVSFPVDERGLATTSNDIVIIVADLGPEKVGAWVEMLPNDTDPAVRAAVEESRDSLTLN